MPIPIQWKEQWPGFGTSNFVRSKRVTDNCPPGSTEESDRE